MPLLRDSVALACVEAASAVAVPRFDGRGDSIIAPEARDRMLERIEPEQLPNDERMTLAGALSGDLRRQTLLFQAMIDTWLRLQKALGEVKWAARKAHWQLRTWAPGGEKPKAAAESLPRGGKRNLGDAARSWAMWPDRCGPIRCARSRASRGRWRSW